MVFVLFNQKNRTMIMTQDVKIGEQGEQNSLRELDKQPIMLYSIPVHIGG